MSRDTDLVLGIDAGATRTRAWLAQLDGAIVACGEGPGANVHALGVDVSRRSIASATAEAWREAGRPGERARGFVAVFAGVAGAGAGDDQRALAAALAAEFGVAAPVCAVSHDLQVALAGALPGMPGAVLVAGTGSACFGRAANGREWKAGGWGPVLDDGGSGHWIGVQAMRAMIRAADGRAGKPSFADAAMAQLGARSPRDLIDLMRAGTGDQAARAPVAALAPLVLAAAANRDDAIAAEIVSRGAEELAAMVEAVWRNLEFAPASGARLAGVGGLLENDANYRDIVGAAVTRRLPHLSLERAQLPPAAGAVLLALGLAGIAPAEAISRMRDSLDSNPKKIRRK